MLSDVNLSYYSLLTQTRLFTLRRSFAQTLPHVLRNRQLFQRIDTLQDSACFTVRKVMCSWSK